MALNKKMLQKVKEKTSNDPVMCKFIVEILQGENNGVGWWNKFYKTEIEKAIQGVKADED